MSDQKPDIDEIFAAAIEITDADQRAQYVQRAAGDDAQLLQRVQKLLRAHTRAGSFMESPAAGLPLLTPVEIAPGSEIGPYKLLEQIGEGGMGTVFAAEQVRPVQRKVALKVIKPGMDTRQVIARFDAERQALAVLDHPNIARVFDAGTTATGRPYFVMEMVTGEPITSYCDRHTLTIEQRLVLFQQVCRAVLHAHQKGLIHRDIKPSNVLVSTQDGQPVAKVIDFGIAKATQARLTEKTLFTELNQLMGTPEYMSPEQAGGSLDLDTRTDVYSLGVLLYELLAGTPPFDARELRSKAYAEMQRIIREVDPPPPSTRISALKALPSIAAVRGMEPHKLTTSLRGELDWIVMRAMEKDRSRRYESASALAADIAHHLAHEPVVAAPISRAYRARKFVRRHRAGVFSAAAIGLLLVAGITGTTIGLTQARQQRDAARLQRLEAERAREGTMAVNDFLTDDILGAVDPRVARGREVTVREALDTAAEKVGTKFRDQPLVEAEVRNTLAVIYYELGRTDLGLPHAQIALALRRRHLGNDHVDTLSSIGNLAILMRSLGRADEAEMLCREAVNTGRRTLGPDDPQTITWLFDLAHQVEDRGDYTQAESMYRQVLASWRVSLGEEHERTLTALSRLGGLLMTQGRQTEAGLMLVESLEKRRRTLGPDHRDTLNSINDLALLRQNERKFDEAEALSRESLAAYRRVLGEDHPFTLTSMNNLGTLRLIQEKFADAEAPLRDATQRSRRTVGAAHPRTLTFQANLGAALAGQGRFSEAEAELLAAERGFAEMKSPPADRRAKITKELAKLYTNWDAAEPGKGYDSKARQWRDAIPATRPA